MLLSAFTYFLTVFVLCDSNDKQDDSHVIIDNLSSSSNNPLDPSELYLYGVGNPVAAMLRTSALIHEQKIFDIVSPIAAIKVPHIAYLAGHQRSSNRDI